MDTITDTTSETDTLAHYCIPVIETFQHLQKTLQKAKLWICEHDKHLPAWFQAPQDFPLPAHLSLREKIFTFLAQVEYLNHQEPREILVGAGLVAASAETLQAIETLNDAKDAFKTAMIALKKHSRNNINRQAQLLNDPFESLLSQRTTQLATPLKRMGLSRLHLKQCYRRIPCFLDRPQKVSWTWANTRAIQRVTHEAAQALLLKHPKDQGIQNQLAQLMALDPKEPLAIVQNLAPHLRANLVLKTSQGAIQRRMVKGPVPLFYLEDHYPAATLPEFHPPEAKKARSESRVTRSDVKLNPEPFLPAIRVHRYLK